MSPLFGSRKDEKPAQGVHAEANEQDQWFLPLDTRDYLRGLFGQLKQPVVLELFTQPGRNDRFSEFCEKLLRDLARVSDKIEVRRYGPDDARFKEAGIDFPPEILVSPERYKLRFTGAPAGEEARSFIETIMLASLGDSGLSQPSRELLATLKEPREAKVFASPTCPYCPGQVMNGVRAAVERPDLVSLRYVEIGENQELADRYNVGSVPHTVFNDSFVAMGQEPEVRFVVELVTLKSAEEWLKEHGAGLAAPEGAKDVDVIILGGGPAGLAAAIYVVRSGLSAVVLEKQNVGGQVALTPVVENYPGFPAIAGAKLVDILFQHSREYAEVKELTEVSEVKLGKRIEVYTLGGEVYTCRALVLAMGATWRQLGVPGEQKFFGRGVSYCASCDGYFYRGRKVAVVGGGNTAITDALHLKHLGAEVTVIHRRGELRAEKHLQDSLAREGIPMRWNSVVTAIEGETAVTGLKIKDLVKTEDSSLPVDGVFIAIGQQANSDLARQIGVMTDEDGFILVDEGMRTNIPRVYAAGDITGGIRQIVTAIGKGTTAALTLFEDLSKRGDV